MTRKYASLITPILSRFHQGRIASASEIASEINETISVVYHVIWVLSRKRTDLTQVGRGKFTLTGWAS